MTSRWNIRLITVGLIAVVLAGVVGYNLRGNTLVKSKSNSKAKTTVVTSNSTSQSNGVSTSNDTSTNSDLKARCVSGLQNYSTSIRAKAEAMSTKIREEAAHNTDRSAFQPQIDELLAYVKSMQTNMAKLQNCISKIDQKQDLSAAELSEIEAAIAASTK